MGEIRIVGPGKTRGYPYSACKNISIFHGRTVWIISIFHVCMVWIEKSVTRVTDRYHEACRVMPNSDPE